VFRTKNDLLLVLTVFIATVIISCAPREREPYRYAPEGVVAPDNLNVEVGDKTMDLIWDTNRAPDMMISGYNIYISKVPPVEGTAPAIIKPGIKPHNPMPYPGDNNPEIEFETYAATNLENGIKYYVAVTTVFPDGTESLSSNVVEVACYPRGTVTLTDRSLEGDHGFSFKLKQYVPYNSLDNDLYFISRDIGNMIGSPDRNDGVLRHTLFAELGRTQLLNDRLDYNNLAFKDRAFVAEGMAYLLKLDYGDYAKILVRRVSSAPYLKQIVFDYIYFEQ